MSVHFSSDKMDWETPNSLFEELDDEFYFELDVCATNENKKCCHYIDKESDGLALDWRYHGNPAVCWMNPPYGREIKHWIKKAAEQSAKGCTVVALIPYRPDTRYWFDYVWEPETNGKTWFGRKPREGVEIRAVKGRLKFGNADNPAPFPSAIVIFRNKP
jgi:site-specific DNA-methyltransferase (adenine-specific)